MNAAKLLAVAVVAVAGSASALLNGIAPAITPDMLKALSAMGHGEEVVISDANFPANLYNKHVIRADGSSASDILAGLAPLFPLDTYNPPVYMMQAVPGDQLDPQVEPKYRTALGYEGAVTRIPYQKFYERARKVACVIVTGETMKYGNVILRKGVVRVEPPKAK